MDNIELLSKLAGFAWWMSVFVKAWNNGDKVWAILSVLPFVSVIYCITHWYEMKNYFYALLIMFATIFVLVFGLAYFGIIGTDA